MEDRIKKLINSREREYTNFQYQQGGKVIVKDIESPIWDEAKVHNQNDNVVIMGKSGRPASVPARPRQSQEQSQKERRNEEEIDDSEI